MHFRQIQWKNSFPTVSIILSQISFLHLAHFFGPISVENWLLLLLWGSFGDWTCKQCEGADSLIREVEKWSMTNWSVADALRVGVAIGSCLLVNASFGSISSSLVLLDWPSVPSLDGDFALSLFDPSFFRFNVLLFLQDLWSWYFSSLDGPVPTSSFADKVSGYLSSGSIWSHLSFENLLQSVNANVSKTPSRNCGWIGGL